ncbi:MAG: T9SS type A sorting domain-containing protein [Bacteroidaceae bacterium]|nr:T9SS type A sorting domain-containing protein [Bacteroidaceae bacterium]
MKKLLLSLLLFTFSALTFAQKKDVLGIFMKDGTSVYFLLAEKPLITFENSDVKVVSSTDEAVLVRSQVDRFEFVADVPTDVEDVQEKVEREKFELTRNAIHLSGLTPGCKVQLFSIGGQSILATAANENGAVTISIDSLPAGIYLVNYNEITIKFIKQ